MTDNRKEPQLLDWQSKLGGHHWLIEYDYDGRAKDTVVLQWAPGAQRWCHSGNLGTGQYVDTQGWKYLCPCKMPPIETPHRDNGGNNAL